MYIIGSIPPLLLPQNTALICKGSVQMLVKVAPSGKGRPSSISFIFGGMLLLLLVYTAMPGRDVTTPASMRFARSANNSGVALPRLDKNKTEPQLSYEHQDCLVKEIKNLF